MTKPKSKPRRKANYVATLIYVDEPQLIVLKAKTVDLIAVAVPSDNYECAKFLAVTVTPRNFESYIDGNTDLRFLFTFPRSRMLYYFDLMKMQDGVVQMTPFEGKLPESDLPSPRLFSSEHTEEYRLPPRANDEEKLLIDGEWDMTEFGDFYAEYADIYYFVAATRNYQDPTASYGRKETISKTFRDKPYRGGSSYRHFYKDLISHSPREERAGLDSIKYSSPGTVFLNGKDELFGEVRQLIVSYLNNRAAVSKLYTDLHNYLSKAQLLTLAGTEFTINSGHAKKIRHSTAQLCAALEFGDLATVDELVQKNPLVAAKIILSLYRRIEDAATYFAQGRMSYG